MDEYIKSKRLRRHDMKYIASVSFGKDSLAMLLRLIKEHKPLDEVVFYDTGMEFDAIYNIRDRIKDLLKLHNIKFTELKPECEFLYKMFDKPVCVGRKNEHKGYSWCGGRCRWGTTEKLKTIEKYCKGCYEYVGIAYDEPYRLKKERKGNKLFPLADWEMSEKDCLEYCKENGYYWLELSPLGKSGYIDLYDILDRVSCFCCGNKNLFELYNYWKYLPKYWQKLKELQNKTDRPFKKPYSVFDLEKRFIGGYIPKHRRREKVNKENQIEELGW